ncbi:hypothetical protein [Tsukamurella sp. NPDC003166]|uniref:hypothetical protein n=1 Tax=Tsukamurella sp. NPDC003166 TaxID=3154444 RepID=UPI0033B36219
MTEHTTPSQPESGEPAQATAPIPEVSAAAPSNPEPTPPLAPSGSGPSRGLLIGGVVLGLVGIAGVSFTAGYWVSEATDHHGGHSMHQNRPGGAQPHRHGSPERRTVTVHPRTSPSEVPTTPSAAPSTPTPAPGA